MWLLDELKKRNRDYENIAIIHRDRRISYAELWAMSESIGAWMEKHLTTDAPILIYGDKDIEIVAIMIAALKTGRPYVPMDIAFPTGRVQKIATITQGEVLFNVSDTKLDVSSDSLRYCINKSALADIVSDAPLKDIDESKWVEGDDICYILFTSGSTGEPKGVQISKKNIISFTDCFQQYATIGGQIVLNQISYSFDVSVIQLYIYMSQGKSLFCIDKEMIFDFKSLFSYLSSGNIASWISTPAFIEMCAANDEFNQSFLPNMEKIILAGEILTKKLVSNLWGKFPKATVINGYGPTEGTVLLTCCLITKKMMDDNKNMLPIGYILNGITYTIDKTVEVSDDCKNGIEIEKGELIVSGKNISKGYYKNQQATQKSFFVKEGDIYPSYRTGDIVYERERLLYFCGRKDFQIKLNGYRIELDDIAENINKIDGVQNNVVIPVYADGKIKHLAAFVKLKPVLGGGDKHPLHKERTSQTCTVLYDSKKDCCCRQVSA